MNRRQLLTLLAAVSMGTILRAGWYARVADTAGRGLRMRYGPGIESETNRVLPEGETVQVLGGPVSNDGYQWYEVRDRTGDAGWVAGDWLVPLALYLPSVLLGRT